MYKFNIGEKVYDILGNQYTIKLRYKDYNFLSGTEEPRYKVHSETCINERAWEGNLYSIADYRNRILNNILN